jgi:methionyl aminopeptidase
MTHLKSDRELEIMARGGRILALTHEHLRTLVRPGISTKELDDATETFIRSHAGATPAFKGMYGFPGSACISVNEEIVHGIPSAKRILRDGDLVKLDVGVKLEGYFTDASITVGVGTVTDEMQRLMDTTRSALEAGIAAAVVGNHIGDIGAAIWGIVGPAGYTVADDLVGHYVGSKLHGDPQVPNKGKPKRGPKLLPGLTIAIEPMVNVGGSATRTLSDKWTIVTADGSRSAHFEHTIAVTPEGPRILTRAA